MSSQAAEILRQAHSFLLIDWPSRDVPDTLVRAGYRVIVKSGPGESDYSTQQLVGDEVVSRPMGRRPDRADVVYAHRPQDEIPGIVSLARSLGAIALWRQAAEDSRASRDLAEAAGLRYVDDVYLADAVRALDQ